MAYPKTDTLEKQKTTKRFVESSVHGFQFLFQYHYLKTFHIDNVQLLFLDTFLHHLVPFVSTFTFMHFKVSHIL